MKPLSWPSIRTLRDLAAGRDADWSIRGRSAPGGLTTVMGCLRRRRLIDKDHCVTPEGMALIERLKKEGKLR